MINCTLERSPQPSNTYALAKVVADQLAAYGVDIDCVRAVDLDIKPGVTSDEGVGDAWPEIHEKLLSSEILVVASPTWLGRPSSIAQRVLERMDAMMSETDDRGRPVAYNRVAGVATWGTPSRARPGRTGTSAPGRPRLPRRRTRPRLVPHDGSRHGREPVRRRPGPGNDSPQRAARVTGAVLGRIASRAHEGF